MDIVCFGIREFEIPFFNSIGNKRNYTFNLNKSFSPDDMINNSKGFKIMMIRGNCIINSDTMKSLFDNGIRIILSRSVGYNNMDLIKAKELGIAIMRVPSYSPNAISEVVIGLSMMLLRNLAYTVNRTSNKDFTIDNQMFSREIRNCTVGIIGCGSIGYTTVKLFEGLGANVIVYNRSKTKDVNYVELDYLIKNSDIISLHMPYKDNYHFVDKEFISKMKKDAILINTSRGELVDTIALIEALENNELYGAGLDVLENENNLFFKKHNELDDLHQRIVNLYPKLLVTPHVGASTDEALRNMIEYSLDNLEEYTKTGKCKNSL